MIKKTGLDLPLLVIAAAMVALCVFGAVALWRGDEAMVGLIALVQVPLYVAAAWLVVMRPAAYAGNGRALVGILTLGLLMRLVILPAPPSSSDAYRYVWDGRVQGAGINPYRYVPADDALRPLRDEAIYPQINRADYAPTIYPPAAQLVYFLATRISDSLTFMKATMIAFEGLAVWAMLQLLAARSLPPTRVLLYVWHPLPLWEFAGSGHVDAMAIAFLLLAFVAADRRSPILAGLGLASGASSPVVPA